MTIIFIILICWGLWYLMPYIGRWLMRLLQRRVQRQMFRSMGIDPSAFEQARKEQARDTGGRREHTSRSRRGRNARGASASTGKIIPEGYGEYVQFTVLQLSGHEPWLDTAASPIYVNYTEEQTTEARYTVINQ